MLVRTVKRGRRTVYQLRSSENKEIISAASEEFLIHLCPHIHNITDNRLRTLCTYYIRKQEKCYAP